MATVEKFSIALTPEQAALVRQVVENGEYASSSEVIRDALREWKLKRDFQQTEIAELRRLWHEGLKSGPGKLGDMKAIKAEARRRLTKA
jgi:antitoxin ParD1/3/4